VFAPARLVERESVAAPPERQLAAAAPSLSQVKTSP
jgi:hypothetical protein